MRSLYLVLLSAAILLFAAGYANAEKEIKPTPTPGSITTIVPTVTPTAVYTPASTATATPTATPTPDPTPTATPTPSPTPITPKPTSTPKPTPKQTPKPPPPVDWSLCQPSDTAVSQEMYVAPDIGVKRRLLPAQNSDYSEAAVQNTKITTQCKRNTNNDVWYRVADAKGSFWTRQEWLAGKPIQSPPPPPPPPPTPSSTPQPRTGNGNVVLTFDDGPYSASGAHRILDILAEKGVKRAIFFLNCQAKNMPDVVSRILSEGHILANHTCNHADLTTLSYQGIKTEILSNEIPGMTKLLRPPYGAHNSFTDSIAAELGYSIMMWTIDTRDWTGVSTATIVSTVANNLHPGAIVLMHLHAPHTIEALPTLIDTIVNAGYTIGY